MRDTIDMAREAGIYKDCDWRYGMKAEGDSLKAFEVLVRADEQKKWQEQTAVEIHEAVLDEREACAKVADEWSKRRDDVGGHISRNIRARGNT
jgi:hypothetical protein